MTTASLAVLTTAQALCEPYYLNASVTALAFYEVCDETTLFSLEAKRLRGLK